MAEMKPLDNTGLSGPNNKGLESPLEKVVQAGKLSSKPTAVGYHPTDADSKMRWDPKIGIGNIDVGEGANVRGGYSIRLNPIGENSVEYYGH